MPERPQHFRHVRPVAVPTIREHLPSAINTVTHLFRLSRGMIFMLYRQTLRPTPSVCLVSCNLAKRENVNFLPLSRKSRDIWMVSYFLGLSTPQNIDFPLYNGELHVFLRTGGLCRLLTACRITCQDLVFKREAVTNT